MIGMARGRLLLIELMDEQPPPLPPDLCALMLPPPPGCLGSPPPLETLPELTDPLPELEGPWPQKLISKTAPPDIITDDTGYATVMPPRPIGEGGDMIGDDMTIPPSMSRKDTYMTSAPWGGQKMMYSVHSGQNAL